MTTLQTATKNNQTRTDDVPVQRREMPITFPVLAWQVYPRCRWDENRVTDLAEQLEGGTELDPITVQRDTGIVLNGWHRVKAYERLGRTHIPVKEVEVPDDQLLAFACQQDDVTGSPYTRQDRQHAARRLYADGKDITRVARDVHRSRQTVERWLHEEIARGTECRRHAQAVRAVVVHALTGTGWSQRQIAPLLGISRATVVSDAHLSIADHLDEDVIDEARAIIDSLGQDDRRQAALDWLSAQREAAASRLGRRARPRAASPENDDSEADDCEREDQEDDDSPVLEAADAPALPAPKRMPLLTRLEKALAHVIGSTEHFTALVDDEMLDAIAASDRWFDRRVDVAVQAKEREQLRALLEEYAACVDALTQPLAALRKAIE